MKLRGKEICWHWRRLARERRMRRDSIGWFRWNFVTPEPRGRGRKSSLHFLQTHRRLSAQAAQAQRRSQVSQAYGDGFGGIVRQVEADGSSRASTFQGVELKSI
jgi:hypothetical protein